jgi:hypothetical protein
MSENDNSLKSIRVGADPIKSPSALGITALNAVLSPSNIEKIDKERKRVESRALEQVKKGAVNRRNSTRITAKAQALTPQVASIGKRVLTKALMKYLNPDLFAIQEVLLALEGDSAARARIWERIEGKADAAPQEGPERKTLGDILAELAGSTPKAVIEAVQSIKFTAPAAPGSAGEAIVTRAMSTDGQDETGSSTGP